MRMLNVFGGDRERRVYETKIIKKFSVVLIVERRFGEVHAR